ncbi:sulfite exporter TauE/SafE family protein [Pseudomonas sp. ABC1]|uniref:sulfite exporter TauE/SafE family protein n=1 Tax=Pseudomonas sp. ABC1 TaxID=2748080 RepID=UPI0015C33635|nr:sulfite exporter TauE/SafE family protein [Pseudomonas sp. ABC1]QLF93640.1 sulfite exporter TauE/SafE family protein [Pseudomonas sp. ABC1]
MPLIESLSPTLLLTLVGVFVLAGLVKGVVGLGLPTIAMALLALWMTPAQAAALLIAPSLLTNVWQARPWQRLPALLKRLAGMQLGVCIGTLSGALLLGAPTGDWAQILLGLVLIAYALWGLFGKAKQLSPTRERQLGGVVGVLTGLVTAATGVFVVPAVPYLQALGLSRDELIQAMGISFSVSTLTLAAGLWLNQSYASSEAGLSLLMLIPALLGMQLGQYLRNRLSPTLFRRCFFGSLILLGLYLASELLA